MLKCMHRMPPRRGPRALSWMFRHTLPIIEGVRGLHISEWVLPDLSQCTRNLVDHDTSAASHCIEKRWLRI